MHPENPTITNQYIIKILSWGILSPNILPISYRGLFQRDSANLL